MKRVKIALKIFLIIMLGIIVINCISIKNVYAEESTSTMDAKSIMDKGKKFIENGSKDPVISEDKVIDAFVPVGQVLVIAANAVILVVVAVMGVKWITAKPEQQAKLKEQLIGLVVAIVVIYGAVGIWTMIKGFMEGL